MVGSAWTAPAVGTLLLLVLLLPAPAAAAPGDVVGTGHIEAGVFLAHPAVAVFLFGPGYTPDEAPYEFSLPVAAHVGETVETVVTDHTGIGYFVDLAFSGDGRNISADCMSTEDSHALAEEPYGFAEIRTRCVVPPGAEDVSVYAHTGIDLDVTLVVV